MVSITEERLKQWEITDKDLFQMLEYLKKTYLSPTKLKIYIKDTQEYMDLYEVIEKIEQRESRMIIYVRALLEYIKDLPHHYERIKESMDDVFMKFVLNKQDIVAYMRQMEHEIKIRDEKITKLDDNLIKMTFNYEKMINKMPSMKNEELEEEAEPEKQKTKMRKY